MRSSGREAGLGPISICWRWWFRLKCFQRLGYFPRGGQVPEVVVEHVRDCLRLDEGTIPDAAERTAEWQRELVRERVGAVFDSERTRLVAEGAIRAAAEVKTHPPDL